MNAQNDAVDLSQLATFLPDLIVEVTSVCDRACPGCYSPTIRSSAAPDTLLREHPDAYLSPERLGKAFRDLNERDLRVSLRGGEPSRHAQLLDLVATADEFCKETYVETHARWLLTDEPHVAIWLAGFREFQTVVKVSFDRMHSLSHEQLRAITDRLSEAQVRWVVAITEPTAQDFERTRALCPWVPEDKLIFQEKVRDHRLLVEPRLGTVSVDGSRKQRLTTKSAMKRRVVLEKPQSVLP
jgi:organic radical activating enzyme